MAVTNSFDFFVQWHLTDKCNLACRHCYQAGIPSGELTFEEIKQVIDEISETLSIWSRAYEMDFSSSFNVTGGEPLLRHDLFKILSEINNKGFEIFLLTNGTLINKEKAEKLAAHDVKGVQVSIEGPEKIHNAIRGKNSFQKSLNGIRNLLAAGLEVTMNVTLSSLNAGQFHDMFQLASGLGVQKIGFSRLVPSGRGKELISSALNTREVEDLYKDIFTSGEKSLKVVTGDPVASQLMCSGEESGNSEIPLGGCAAGISGITIMPDGTLLPCRRLPVPLGNIRTDSLRDIWATSDVLCALRDRSRYKGKCGSCSKWSTCRGCRAIAYAFSEVNGSADLLAEDPQCFINCNERKGYAEMEN